jgi:hypothetical protein
MAERRPGVKLSMQQMNRYARFLTLTAALLGGQAAVSSPAVALGIAARSTAPDAGPDQPDPVRLAKATRLVEAMHIEVTFDQMMTQMDQQNLVVVKGLFPNLDTDPAQKQEFDAYMAKVSSLVHGSFSWEQMEPEYSRIYAATFTADQLDAIAAFYSSPTGQLMIEKTPMILSASMSAAQSRMSALLPKIRERMEAEATRVQAMQAKKNK